MIKNYAHMNTISEVEVFVGELHFQRILLIN